MRITNSFLSLIVLAVILYNLAYAFSNEAGAKTGTITSIEPASVINRLLPVAGTHYGVRLSDGSIVSVATQHPDEKPVGAEIRVTEWVAPWGEVWYSLAN